MEALSMMKNCPVKTTLKYIGKRWSIEIVRDLMFCQNCRFSDFLSANPGLSSKMLSQRLKELERHSIIKKIVTNDKPLRIEYRLTERGSGLNKILYELALFSYQNYQEDIFEKEPLSNKEFHKMSVGLFNLS